MFKKYPCKTCLIKHQCMQDRKCIFVKRMLKSKYYANYLKKNVLNKTCPFCGKKYDDTNEEPINKIVKICKDCNSHYLAIIST